MSGVLAIACPPWHNDSSESELDAPPCVQLQMVIASNVRGSARPIDVRYSTAAGMHKLCFLEGFELQNFTVIQDYRRSRSVFHRYTSVAPIRLAAGGKVVAALTEDATGEVLAAYAVDSTGAVSRHAQTLIGMLDIGRGIFAVRDVHSPLSRAVFAWLLLRCVGMDATGIKHRGA